MLVTDIKRVNKKGEEKTGFYMDGYLKRNLDGVPAFLKKEWDVVGVVSGHGKVGTGKSLLPDSSVKIVKDDKIIDSKPIGDYKDGDILDTISYDFKSKKIVPSKSRVIIEDEKKDYYEVKMCDGRIVNCTMEHCLFVKRKNKIIELPLRLINKGDELVCK